MGLLIGIAIFFLVMGLVGIGAQQSTKEKLENNNKLMLNAMQSVPDFTLTRKVVGLNNDFTFATDDERNKIMIVKGSNAQVYDFDDIISVEKIENGEVVSKKSTGRTIGGFVLGGALAGGVGAIVGGLSGSSKTSNLHSSLKVKILLRNNSVPSVEIVCYDCNTMGVEHKPVSDNDTFYKIGLNNANTIVDTLSVIIDAVDRRDKGAANVSVSQASVADELAKLAVLKEKGILSEDEFNEQKDKLLHNTPSNNTEKPKVILPHYDPLDDQIKNLISMGLKIEAIKAYRDAKGCSLEEAKMIIDSMYL